MNAEGAEGALRMQRARVVWLEVDQSLEGGRTRRSPLLPDAILPVHGPERSSSPLSNQMLAGSADSIQTLRPSRSLCDLCVPSCVDGYSSVSCISMSRAFSAV